MGKSTISMAMASIAMAMITRGIHDWIHGRSSKLLVESPEAMDLFSSEIATAPQFQQMNQWIGLYRKIDRKQGF